MDDRETQYLTPGQLAEMLKVSESTLRRWRREGIGPTPTFLSQRTVRYDKDNVTAWLAIGGLEWDTGKGQHRGDRRTR